MGKILIIQGADFSQYKVDSVKLPVAVEIPQISIDSESKLVTLTANENLDIYYTTDGSTPSLEANLYTEAFEISSLSTVVKTITYNGKTVSQLPKITATVNIDEEENSTLELTSSVSGTIRYTTDNSTPTATSASYSSAISISNGQTYKIAVYNGSFLVSEISTIQITD